MLDTLLPDVVVQPGAPKSFVAHAVLFDMDGTLVDSIAAVEAAWGKVALDIGQDPEYVIAATHGKRAIDNLAQFKPHIPQHALPAEVQAFEETILAFADEYLLKQEERKRRASSVSLLSSSGFMTPGRVSISSASGSEAGSRYSSAVDSRKSSFNFGFGGGMQVCWGDLYRAPTGGGFDIIILLVERTAVILEDDDEMQGDRFAEDWDAAWELEEEVVNRSVRILPGRYAVATSGAKTYAYGAMSRVNIIPPPITITADDPRLKNGKPHPDPFLLAAAELGFPASECVVFEDSPSGIKAGVASGATVVALCTSHTREKILGLGAHYVLDTMESLKVTVLEDGRMKFDVVGN
ncbi:HAD-like domain-containing protein [Cantharellus anzutake]|uniref:HAD-like domain-containing protein n=1 Tax=Cantharellus anzutake TaxID=1750568 RepID=UPI001906FCDA|nr:HAD-like domain-containing protein [Cantharellus anzutake]KAF8344217.1 HAD-like domain-containing protein [Cantharellus anzutake]